jgi:small subunit ribosomal protein S20
MPHTSSAKKRLRQTQKRRMRNRNVKKEVKTRIKEVLTATGDQLRDAVRLAVKKLDQAAAKGVVHRNLVARKKSQLARLLNKTAAAQAPKG